MRHAMVAEWTKLRTVPSTAWSLLAVVGLTVGLSALVTAATEPLTGCGNDTPCVKDTTLLSLSGVTLGQIAVILLGVLTVSTEYDAMMIRSTLAAQPRRGIVFTAKAIVVTVAILASGLVSVFGALITGRLMLSGNGFTAAHGYPPVSLADDPTLRASIGTVLYFGLVGLLSLGIAATLRHAATAVTTAMAVLYIPVLVVLIVPLSPHVLDRVERYSPMPAGLAVRTTVELPDPAPIGPWAGLGVLAAYAGAGLVLGLTLFKTRDA